jgi:hypothetical protein
MRRVARHVAQMAQTLTVGLAGPIHPRKGQARNDSRGEKRKLKARIEQLRGFPNEQHERRQGNRIQQIHATEKRPRAQIKCSHQSGAENRRAILHDTHVSGKRRESDKGRDAHWESQPAA